MSDTKIKPQLRGVTLRDMSAAIQKLSDSGVHFESAGVTPGDVAAAIELLDGKPTHNRVVADIILNFISEPKPLKEPRQFHPLKQSRAMEMAQSRIRADFSPVSICSKVADGWRR